MQSLPVTVLPGPVPASVGLKLAAEKSCRVDCS
jgi:hypothetical protein